MSEVEVRDRILQEATRLFARQGYGSTSVRQIVEAAGVSKPTLYYWFKNKEALFETIVQTHIDRVEALLEAALGMEADTSTRLTSLVRTIYDRVRAETDLVEVLMTAHHRPEEGQPRVDLMWLHLRKMDLLEQLFVEGQARGEVRSDTNPKVLVMAFLGVVNLHMVARCRDVPTASPEHVVDLFLHGAAAP